MGAHSLSDPSLISHCLWWYSVRWFEHKLCLRHHLPGWTLKTLKSAMSFRHTCQTLDVAQLQSVMHGFAICVRTLVCVTLAVSRPRVTRIFNACHLKVYRMVTPCTRSLCCKGFIWLRVEGYLPSDTSLNQTQIPWSPSENCL